MIYHSLYIGDNSGKDMSRLKLRIEKDGCHEECLCGDCGYVYEEYEIHTFGAADVFCLVISAMWSRF